MGSTLKCCIIGGNIKENYNMKIFIKTNKKKKYYSIKIFIKNHNENEEKIMFADSKSDR